MTDEYRAEIGLFESGSQRLRGRSLGRLQEIS